MGKRKNEYRSCQNDVIDVQVFLMLPQRRRERKDSERCIVCFYFEGEVSPIKNLRHGRRRRKMISDVLRNAKLAPIILHGRKMMGTAPASCLNLPKHFGSLYLEPVFFPHGQKPASAVSVFKQAILRYPLSKN